MSHVGCDFGVVWGVCGAGWCREGIRGYGRFEWYFGIFALLERVDVVGVVVTGSLFFGLWFFFVVVLHSATAVHVHVHTDIVGIRNPEVCSPRTLFAARSPALPYYIY